MAFGRIRRLFSGTGTGGTGASPAGATTPGGVMEGKKAKQLWGKQFDVVEGGLSEEQVVAYVNELMGKYQTLAAQQEHILSLEKVLQRAAVEADKVAAGIRAKAEEEAEAEAARIISEAKERSQELITEAKKRAESLTDEEVRNILYAANTRADIIETEARQRSQLYLLRSREIIESELKEEVKVTYHRLLSALQNLLHEGETIGIEWKGKTAELWKGKAFELAAHEVLPPIVTRLGEAEALPGVPLAAEAGAELDITQGEAVEQPVEVAEEAAVFEEVVEHPIPPEQEFGVPEEAVAVSPEPEGLTVEGVSQQVTEEKVAVGGEEGVLEPKVFDPRLYTGEVELALTPPVDLVMMSELEQQLQLIPEVKILRTVGSFDQGTTITIAVDKPIPLIDMLSEACAVEVSPEPANRGNVMQRTFRERGKVRDVKRVRIVSRNQVL